MPESATMPEAVDVGTRALEGAEGFNWINLPHYREEVGRWVFSCRLTVEVPDAGPVPATTHWWVLIPQVYPAGEVEVLPAKKGGLEVTFPHQLFNAPGNPDRPWRAGKLCLQAPLDIMDQPGLDTGPRRAAHRLPWVIARCREWLRQASRGDLLRNGQSFELPDFRLGAEGRLVTFETAERLELWRDAATRSGFVELWRLPPLTKVRIVGAFTDSNGRVVVSAPSWSPSFRKRLEDRRYGIWVRIEAVPYVEPWQAPSDYRELTDVLRRQGVDLKTLLPPLLASGRESSAVYRLEPRPQPTLLVGFPIPEEMAGDPVRIHWVGFDLPELTASDEHANGFRTNARGQFEQDRRHLLGLKPLPWRTTESWTDEDLTGRGRLPTALRRARVALLGAGALGSAVAELLVRGGVRSMLIVDADAMEAGNLVRHTLTLNDLGRNKAEALAHRLSALSPHAEISAEAHNFPNLRKGGLEQLGAANLVLDLTASRSVPPALAAFDWGEGSRHFARLSVNLGAERLFVFGAQGKRFPVRQYNAEITPELRKEMERIREADLPRDAPGCWHPLWPGSAAAVHLMAASAIPILIELMEEGTTGLTILERREEAGRFHGLTRVEKEAG